MNEVFSETAPAAEAPSEPVKSAKETPFGTINLCPHCGGETDKSPVVEPTDSDKVEWVRHLYGKRFSKTYPRMFGKVSIEFRSRTGLETDAATEAAAFKAKSSGGVVAMFNPLYVQDLRRLLLAGSLVSVTVASDTADGWVMRYPEFKAKTQEELSGELRERIFQIRKDLSDALYNVVGDAYAEFELLMLVLLRRAKDDSFFKGAVEHI